MRQRRNLKHPDGHRKAHPLPQLQIAGSFMQKTCRQCKESKPLDAFSKKRAAKDGLMGICKICDAEKSRKWQAENPQKAKEKRDLHRAKNREKYLKLDRERYWNNIEDALKKRKEYYLKKSEEIKARASKYAKNNRHVNNKSQKKHYANNKAWYMAKSAKRRASKISATPTWLDGIHLAQIKWFYTACAMMTETSGIQHHVDHIHPLQGDGFNGLHVPWNLRIIPAKDNISKGNSLPPEMRNLMWEDR